VHRWSKIGHKPSEETYGIPYGMEVDEIQPDTEARGAHAVEFVKP
jgi:hypothetical protein